MYVFCYFSVFKVFGSLGVKEGDAYGQRFFVVFVHNDDETFLLEFSLYADDSWSHYVSSVTDVGDGAHVHYNFWKEGENVLKRQRGEKGFIGPRY